MATLVNRFLQHLPMVFGGTLKQIQSIYPTNEKLLWQKILSVQIKQSKEAMKMITRYRPLILIAVILFTTLIGLTTEDFQNKFMMITILALIACAWIFAFDKSCKID
jgi:hypothetical protein